MPSILGMLHTKSFNDTDRRPLNWREYILYQDPNGQAPLTALLSLQKGEPTDDPQFNFWTQSLPNQRGAITGVYTDALTTAYNPASAGACAAAGTALWIKCSATEVVHAKPGHMLLIRDAAYMNLSMGKVARVEAVVVNGANSYVKVILAEPDTWVTNSYIKGGRTAPNSDMIFWILGSAYAEGSGPPQAIVYEPTKNFNYTQIFKTKLSMTRTAMKTKLRTGDHVKAAKAEALRLHSLEMEKAFLFGLRSEAIDATTNTPIRTTAGLINYPDAAGVRQITPVSFSGTWNATDSTGAWAWLFGVDGIFEQLFRFGSQERIMFCGSSAISAINQMAKANSALQMSVVDTAIGMQFNKLVTPAGTVLLKNHPLMSLEPSMRKSAILLDPDNLIYRPLDDTFYEQDIQANGQDSKDSQYITEAGLELHFPNTFAVLNNLGG